MGVSVCLPACLVCRMKSYNNLVLMVLLIVLLIGNCLTLPQHRTMKREAQNTEQEQEQLSIDLPAVPEMLLTLPRNHPCNVKNSKCVPCCGPALPFYLQCRTNCG